MRNNFSRVPGKIDKEIEFFRGQANVMFSHTDGSRRNVNAEVPDFDQFSLWFQGSRSAPEGSSYARQQLVRTEWLRDVVIGSGIERFYLDGLFALDGEHNDGKTGFGTNAPA